MPRRDGAHWRYSKGRAKLAFGRTAEGRIVHVSAVDRGLDCGCWCPACGARLIAKEGSKTAHFAHERDAACAHAVETMLHYLGKDILEAERRLLVPAVVAEAKGVRVETHSPREWTFDGAILEHRLDGVVPDIVVRLGERDLLVEIYVTHRCDAEKAAKLRALGLPTMEIDLSKLPRDATREQVARAVIETAPRRWVYNPKVDEAEQRLQAILAERAASAERYLDRSAEILAQQWRALVAKPFVARPDLAETVKLVREYGYGAHIGRGEAVRTMNAVPLLWQAVLLKAFVIDAARYPSRNGLATVPQGVGLLRQRGLVADLFATDRKADFLKRVRRHAPDFRTPQNLVRAFFNHLTEAGLLKAYADRGWYRTEAAWVQVETNERAWRAAAEREADLAQRVAALLAQAAPEADGFKAEVWLRRRHRDLGGSPAQIAREGAATWDKLSRGLSALSLAFRRDDAPQSLLGLPLGPAIQRASAARAAEAERLRREAAAKLKVEQDGRAERLMSHANFVLGEEAAPWLAARMAGLEGAPTRLQAAARSPNILYDLGELLTREHQRNCEAIKRAASADAFVAKLRKAATALHDEDWAKAFLDSTNPRLGGRPREICVDEASYQRCLSLITPRRVRRA